MLRFVALRSRVNGSKVHPRKGCAKGFISACVVGCNGIGNAIFCTGDSKPVRLSFVVAILAVIMQEMCGN